MNALEKACFEARFNDVKRLCKIIKQGKIVYYAILGGCAKCLEYVILQGFELNEGDIEHVAIQDLNNQMTELVDALRDF